MPYVYKDGDDLNFAVMYARGWNDAIREAVKIITSKGCGECDYMHIYAREISALDRSMQAAND